MNWLQFFASVIGSLVWPFTVLTVLLLFRGRISSLFPLIERFKYRDFEIEFRKSLKELTEKSRTALPAQEVAPSVASPQDQLYSLAELSPRSAILEAWLQVEMAGAEALRDKDPTFVSKAAMAPLRLGEMLNQKQIINGAQLEVFRSLRDLRNKAVHVGDAVFTSDEVAQYITLAISLASQIRRGSYKP